MSETLRNTLSADAERHAESSCEHRHAPEDWGTWGTHEELPQARLYPADLQAVSFHQPLNDPLWTDAYGRARWRETRATPRS
jgi:hypothetical protein